MGVFLSQAYFHRPDFGLPHTRGGVSTILLQWLEAQTVFPTHVGVFPTGHPAYSPRARLPHTRGGVSTRNAASLCIMSSSPHTWGCFHPKRGLALHHVVFPTHVGVFLTPCPSKQGGQGLPHTRGGVSMAVSETFADALSSPHTWGCFTVKPAEPRPDPVFPTHVGVFPTSRQPTPPDVSLPHTRGGVSTSTLTSGRAGGSSPHTWGCFLLSDCAPSRRKVFPTHVGVFLHAQVLSRCAQRLPHTRGGVSQYAVPPYLRPLSSPHTWGCFLKPYSPPAPSLPCSRPYPARTAG